MNEIEIFRNSEFGEIEIAMVDDTPYFKANDVCRCLGYAKPRNAIKNHVHPKDALIQGSLSKGGEQQTTFINESGLYALIMRSKREEAMAFQRWVTSELLPTLRKTGQYVTEARTKELEMQNQKLLAEAEENAHKVNFFDNVTNLETAYNKRKTLLISKLARNFKMSAPALNKFLIRKGVIMRVDGGYGLTPKYADENIAWQNVKEKPEYNSEGELVYAGRVYLEYYPKGVELIKELLIADGKIKAETKS